MMTGHGIPMLGMDGGGAMNVDAQISAMALDDVDLFGDPVIENALDVHLQPTRPSPSKQLRQRLDELRTRGCCQGIAWSRQGTIASVSKDGRSVDLRFLRCHPENGVWDLSEAHSGTAWVSSVNIGTPVTHLAWAATSSPELAVIDAVGRIYILSFSISLNKAYPVRKWDSDAVDDLNAVVGCYWLPLGLPQNRQVHVTHGPAVWTGNDYKYENSLYPATGPWHPNLSKSALVCLTTNGLLKLFFAQSTHPRVEETALELESITSSDDLITHSSICSDKSALLIAYATASRQLKVARVGINWGLPRLPADSKVPPVPPGSIPLNPAFQEKHVAITSWLQWGPSESVDSSMAQLTLMEILPSALRGQIPGNPPKADMVNPSILTVRTYIPADNSPYQAECQSIIDRWELRSDQAQTLHPAWEQLTGPRKNTLPPAHYLRKLESIVIPKVIVSIHQMQLGKVICFAFSDGTVQYRDRFTFDEIYQEQNVQMISSPHQVGFQFTNETPCLQVAFSPTNCSFAQVCEDGKVKWNLMRYPTQDVNAALQGMQQDAIMAALSLAISSAAMNGVNCDDVLAIARPFTQKPDFTHAWIKEIVKLLKIHVDYSEEVHHDQLVRNQHLQLCLSIINHFGFQGEFKPRSFDGRFAMLALNVRNIVILITIASNTPVNLKEKLSPLDEPEVVESLAGCARWAVNLLCYLSDCIFDLLNDGDFLAILGDPKRFGELTRYLQSKNEVALHLLLCSSTRGLLSAACRRLVHLELLSSRAISYYKAASTQADPAAPAGSAAAAAQTTTPRPPSALYHAYQKMRTSSSSNLIKVADFEKLLSGLNQDIRTAYNASLPAIVARYKQQQQQQSNQGNGNNSNEHVIKKVQAQFELDMLLAGNPPPAFREVLVKFFHQSVRGFMNGVSQADLYYGDYSLLEVDDDKGLLDKRRRQGRYIDVFKRIELIRPDLNNNNTKKTTTTTETSGDNGGGNNEKEGPQWRRCVRCAAVMEDIYGSRPGFTFVLAQQRKCSCGGAWGLLQRSSSLVA
ncbi:RNA polymerase II mediator complex subunit Sin4 [Diplogelasinospora grovesii]|uniref:Mediator of RNA polymerase II transcription subunit 16 n=1 Tax=Diplogelasinospora grovesii TaxID=303347 RepID=A0AAN6NGF1_9PEZI|nr:RNA polymerase II mediator complex subunit Sin4 [Diplogelasinospora grovesii]